uniref:Putative secreted protein n=1 Tax=Anopheles darlingi TaxID=43151 RepID=A0A2M4DS48_ANODA
MKYLFIPLSLFLFLVLSAGRGRMNGGILARALPCQPSAETRTARRHDPAQQQQRDCRKLHLLGVAWRS